MCDFSSVLGIQQYLFENNRIDNIFTDFYYDRFTECLNDILATYQVSLNSQGSHTNVNIPVNTDVDGLPTTAVTHHVRRACLYANSAAWNSLLENMCAGADPQIS